MSNESRRGGASLAHGRKAPRAVEASPAMSESTPPSLLQDGPLEAPARAALDRLSDALVRVEPTALRESSLASGHVGLALAHAYLAPIFPERPHGDAMQSMLDAAMDSVASGPSAPSLHSGFVGLSWLVQHLQSDDGEESAEAAAPPAETDEGDPNASVDAELLQWLGTMGPSHPFDLIEGLVGVGLYALERTSVASGRAIVERVVDRLAEAASHERDGLAWPTHIEWIPPAYRAGRPERYFDLGLAHGQAGVLGFLGAACARGLAKDRAATLLARGMDWMLAQRLADVAAESRFPTWIVPGEAPYAARDAWCYGDPGVAISLLIAARGANEPSWEAAALEVARHAAARPLGGTRCADAGLCHGAMGDAHIFHRLHRMTGDPLFAERARAYLELGLRLGGPAAGVGGFSAWGPIEDAAPIEGAADEAPRNPPVDPAHPALGWTPEPGFLTGAAGIALVLAAALGPGAGDADDDDRDGPSWDRVLLTSARGTARPRAGTPR